jgi:hypothetical protein
VQYEKCICCIKINLPKFYIPRNSKTLIVGSIEKLKIESSNDDSKKATLQCNEVLEKLKDH